jgi:hypothetical protein
MQEAEAVWHEWNPLIWGIIKKRGVSGGHFFRSGDARYLGGVQALDIASSSP